MKNTPRGGGEGWPFIQDFQELSLASDWLAVVDPGPDLDGIPDDPADREAYPLGKLPRLLQPIEVLSRRCR